MPLIHEREQSLLAALKSALPGHAVVADARDLATLLRLRTIPGPAAILRIVAWDASADAVEWSIVLLEDAAGSADARRIGDGEGGLFAAIGALRHALGAIDGLRPVGGRIARTESKVLAWEEMVREVGFASEGRSPARLPSLAASLQDAGEVASGALADDVHFDELDTLEPGARILAWHPTIGARDLGVVVASEPGRNELVLPLEVDLPVGTQLATAAGIVVLPRGTQATTHEEFPDWRTTEVRLDGRWSAGIVGPRTMRITFELPLTTDAIEGLLALSKTQAQFLHLEGTGGILAVAPAAYSAPSGPPRRTAATLRMRAVRVDELDAFLEGL